MCIQKPSFSEDLVAFTTIEIKHKYRNEELESTKPELHFQRKKKPRGTVRKTSRRRCCYEQFYRSETAEAAETSDGVEHT